MKPWTPWLLVLLATQLTLVTGCTSALWDKKTFAEGYRPASPSNLSLFYFRDRKDILVQYDEVRDRDRAVRTRYYWLEQNTTRVNRERKPRFVSARPAADLTPIPVVGAPMDPPPPGLNGLYAVAPRYDDIFSLCTEGAQDPYQLPAYPGRSQTVKQVALTPFALAVDATIVGAVVAYFTVPTWLGALTR